MGVGGVAAAGCVEGGAAGAAGAGVAAGCHCVVGWLWLGGLEGLMCVWVGVRRFDWCFCEWVRDGVWMGLGRRGWQLGWMDVDNGFVLRRR